MKNENESEREEEDASKIKKCKGGREEVKAAMKTMKSIESIRRENSSHFKQVV